MGRPKKVKYDVEVRFQQEARLLAESYATLLSDRKTLSDLLSGDFVYTEEMAIQDLLGSGQQEGERVQTSNISNIPERIAILLADGYVEKQRARMQKEAQEHLEEYRDICGKIETVETAMAERMDSRTRAVFTQLCLERKKKSLVVDAYRKRLYRQQVDRALKEAICAIAEELAYREFVKSCEREDEALWEDRKRKHMMRV